MPSGPSTTTHQTPLEPSRQSAGPTAEGPSLRAEVLSALKWTAAARFTGQIATWAITLLVIRLLEPSDYGLVATAGILIGFATLIQELGFIPALIQAKDIDDRRIRQIFGVVFLTNILVYACLFFIAPAFAGFFGQAEIETIIRILGLQVLIATLASIPVALLRRALKLKVISLVELFATITGSLTTLVLAYTGHGVWALVYGTITTSVISTLVFLYITKFRMLPLFNFAGIGQFLGFSANITAAQSIWYFSAQADIALVGKLLGNELLGLYSVAHHLAKMPLAKTISIINQVAFPAYARIQDDLEQCRRHFLLAVQIMSLLMFPMLWGLSSVSQDLVTLVLGERWAEAAIVLQLISLAIPLKAIDMMLSPLVDGLGRSNLHLRNVLTYTAILPLALLAGVNWGIAGVSVAYVIAYIPIVILNCRRSLVLIGSSTGELTAHIWPIALAAAIMYGAVTALAALLPPELGLLARLGLMVGSGVLVFTGLALLLCRDLLGRTYELLRPQR